MTDGIIFTQEQIERLPGSRVETEGNGEFTVSHLGLAPHDFTYTKFVSTSAHTLYACTGYNFGRPTASRISRVITWADGKDDNGDEYATMAPPQVGGSHYKNMAIQPATFIRKNGIKFHEGCVIKYVCRHMNKNGREDIEKAIQFLEMILEEDYGKAQDHQSVTP